MKKALLITAFLVSIISSAQVEEEALYLNGGLGFSSSTISMGLDFGGDPSGGTGSNLTATATSLSIGAGGGYMFTDQFGGRPKPWIHVGRCEARGRFADGKYYL